MKREDRVNYSGSRQESTGVIGQSLELNVLEWWTTSGERQGIEGLARAMLWVCSRGKFHSVPNRWLLCILSRMLGNEFMVVRTVHWQTSAIVRSQTWDKWLRGPLMYHCWLWSPGSPSFPQFISVTWPSWLAYPARNPELLRLSYPFPQLVWPPYNSTILAMSVSWQRQPLDQSFGPDTFRPGFRAWGESTLAYHFLVPVTCLIVTIVTCLIVTIVICLIVTKSLCMLASHRKSGNENIVKDRVRKILWGCPIHCLGCIGAYSVKQISLISPAIRSNETSEVACNRYFLFLFSFLSLVETKIFRIGLSLPLAYTFMCTVSVNSIFIEWMENVVRVAT